MLAPFTVPVGASPDWRAVATAIWRRAQPRLPERAPRVILHVHAGSGRGTLVDAGGPPTPLPFLADWIEHCRERWPSAEVVICWQAPSGVSDVGVTADLQVLAERYDGRALDLRHAERASLRLSVARLSVPLLWLTPGVLFLFAPLTASATDGLLGARAALTRAAGLDDASGGSTPPVVPALTVLDVRHVAAVVGSEQLVVARPGVLAVAADPAAADALGAETLASAGLPAEALLSVEPERVAERWEALLTRQADALAHRAASVAAQAAIAKLPGSLRRLRRGPGRQHPR